MTKQLSLNVVLVFSLVIAMGVAASAQNSVYYFPHVADGSFLFGTEFWFNNVQATPTDVTLNFYDEAGDPWIIDLRGSEGGGGQKRTFTFTIQPSAKYSTTPSRGLALASPIAWATSSGEWRIATVSGRTKPPARVNVSS